MRPWTAKWGDMAARTDDELFEVFDEDGRRLGLEARVTVHAQGLWHRSVNVWVFRSDGCLLLQRRAADKDLFPCCWDYSVGEHLRPGESWLAGAQRGLAEELGITASALQPLGGMRRVRNEHPRLGILDRELTRSYRLQHDGPIAPDGIEVAEICWLAPTAVLAWMQAEAEAFTPWFINAVGDLDWEAVALGTRS